MPTYTFTPGSTVPQGADNAVIYTTGSPTDGFGTDDTPAGWPTSGNVTAVEVEVTSTDEFTGDGQVQIGVATPDALFHLPGATTDASATFSGHGGGVGQYRSAPYMDAYYLNKFGGWRTDYLSFSTGIGTSNTAYLAGVPAYTDQPDVRFTVRVPSWSSTGAATITASSPLPLIRCDGATGLCVGLPYPAGGPWIQRYALCPWANLGAVDGEWLTARVTWDNTNRLRFWVPAGGGGWTVVHSDALSGYTFGGQYYAAQKIGNGWNASGVVQWGLGGDIADVEAWVDGVQVARLQLDTMTSSTAGSWAGGSRASGVTVHGATIPGTVRVRGDLEAPCAVEDLRLIIDAQTGALTVDEIVLELAGGRRGLGLIR